MFITKYNVANQSIIFVFITKYNVANQSIICTRSSFFFQKVFDADSNTGMALAWAGEHGVSNYFSKSWTA